MATISKFYLLDSISPNTGIMPAAADLNSIYAATGQATGWDSARDATDTPGSSDPDVTSSFSSQANQNSQSWGHRFFVSRPLAAGTFGSGTWTFSFARSESSLNHNQSIKCIVRPWRPSTGAFATSLITEIISAEPTSAGSVQATAPTGAGSDQTILDGDILVFVVRSTFTQSHSTSYTDTFEYDGTTEASITTCASFVTPPTALTLFTQAGFSPPFGMRNRRTIPLLIR